MYIDNNLAGSMAGCGSLAGSLRGCGSHWRLAGSLAARWLAVVRCRLDPLSLCPCAARSPPSLIFDCGPLCAGDRKREF